MPSNLSQRLPLFICIHQEETANTVLAIDPPTGLVPVLCAVYLCGGRVAQHELDVLLKTYGLAPGEIKPYLLSRQDLGETWWSYSHSGLAKQLEHWFATLDHRTRTAWARHILLLLPLRVDYPLFSIACVANDDELLVSHYTLDIVKSLLPTAPRELLVYFRKVRRYARKTHKPDLLLAATVNYIAMLMRLGKSHITNIYTIVCSITPLDQKTALALHALFFSIGQIFGREQDGRHLRLATDCYQRCQTVIVDLQDVPTGTREQMLASISNGLALVALKQGDPARALQMESAGLLEIKNSGSSPQQHILMKTHIGDLLLRSFGKLEEAIAQYEEAHALAAQEASMSARLYVVPRLARAYTRTRAFTRAIDVLEELLAAWKWQPDDSSKSGALIRLEILLPLAQAYLSAGRAHDAARCYLQILLKPEEIDPAVLKGIAHNLRHCLPGQRPSFWSWVEDVIVTQEQLLADMDRLCRLFAA